MMMTASPTQPPANPGEKRSSAQGPPNFVPDMFKNKYIIGSMIAMTCFIALSFSGVSFSSEAVVKALGLIIVVGVIAWFVKRPWN